MSKIKKKVFSWGALLLILYMGICGYFFVIQNTILFKPYELPVDHSYSYSFDFDERWFQVDENVRIHAIHAKSPDSSKGLVIFFHGNLGNNDTSPGKFTLFLNEGYDVLYPDYREYGKSSGELWDEEDLTGDMKKVYKEMTVEYAEDRIYLVGYSLGSGVAAQVAAEYDPAGLMLWTPYYSMLDIKDGSYPFLPDFLVRYPLRTDLALQQVDEPVVIFYAGMDQILPIERAMKLNRYLKPGDRHVVLEGQRHGGVFRNPKLIHVTKGFLSN